MLTADLVAGAFDLGRPRRELTELPRTTFQTWRLDTSSGAFLIKRLWRGADPGWRLNLEAAMDFERRATAIGVSMPRPVMPPVVDFGGATRIDDCGLFRAYEWIEHRELRQSDDIGYWLGTTLAMLHRMEPLKPSVRPLWYGLYDRETWRKRLLAGQEQRKLWGPILRTRLEEILALTVRIEGALVAAADVVTTHNDIEPWNVLLTTDGPVLVDWDTVGPESATLQAVHVARSFGFGRVERVREVLTSYRAAGGVIAQLGPDLLLRTAGLRLCRTAESIDTVLAPRQQRHNPDVDVARVDERIGQRLVGLPRFVADLSRQADEIGAELRA